MTWILPRQLHTSAYVQDMEGLNLDLNESSQICAQSLFVRSKPSPARTWSLKWKRDSWTQHLFGRILKPSLGTSFVTAWTSLLEVTPASRSAQPENDLEEKTQDTCGPTFQTGFEFFNQASASLRMSKGTSRWDCPASSAIWKSWVIKSRGEYSARLNAAHLTKDEESSYLPTPCANEDSFRLNGSSQQSKCLEAKARRGELKTAGYAPDVDRMSLMAVNATIMNLSVLNAQNGHIHLCGKQQMDALAAEQIGQNGITQKAGPLNPQFVEMMMGIPVGWTDCVSSETE